MRSQEVFLCPQYWTCWRLDSDTLTAGDLLLPATRARSSQQRVSLTSNEVKDSKAQLLNHLHTSHRHVCEDQHIKKHTHTHTLWKGVCDMQGIYMPTNICLSSKSSAPADKGLFVWKTEWKAFGSELQLWKCLGWRRWCKQRDRLQTLSRCAWTHVHTHIHISFAVDVLLMPQCVWEL